MVRSSSNFEDSQGTVKHLKHQRLLLWRERSFMNDGGSAEFPPVRAIGFVMGFLLPGRSVPAGVRRVDWVMGETQGRGSDGWILLSFPFSFKPSSWEAVANEEMWQARWRSFAPFQQPVGKASSLAWKYTPKRAASWCTALLDLNVPSCGRKRLAEWDEGCTASCKPFRKVLALFNKRFCSKYLEGAEGSLDIGWENRFRREIFITGVLTHTVKKLCGHVEDVYNHVMWAGYI